MFKKLLRALKADKAPVEPIQGSRLERSETGGGEIHFTIKGQRFPGFFVFFGLMFGGIPSIMLLAILFGSSDSDTGDSGGLLAILFLIPFFLVGAGTLFAGLFLWLGRTIVTISATAVSVQRELCGEAFQEKRFERAHLDLRFEESHKTNDTASYKLTLEDPEAQKKIGVGGSLAEAELLWLEREARLALGLETVKHTGVVDALMSAGIADFDATAIIPDYRSKNLTCRKTTTGWEVQSQTTSVGAIGLMIFGSIFFIAGLLMSDSAREFIFDLLPALREAFANSTSSGGGPPFFFPFIFGGVGLGVMLFGIFLLGYRTRISKRHARLHTERRWFVFVSANVHELADLTELEAKQCGHVNNDPRYSLNAHFKHGKKTKLLGFASAGDLGQVHARLSEHLKEWIPPTLSEKIT